MDCLLEQFVERDCSQCAFMVGANSMKFVFSRHFEGSQCFSCVPPLIVCVVCYFVCGSPSSPYLNSLETALDKSCCLFLIRSAVCLHPTTCSRLMSLSKATLDGFQSPSVHFD